MPSHKETQPATSTELPLSLSQNAFNNEVIDICSDEGKVDSVDPREEQKNNLPQDTMHLGEG